jgi:hypothetical protein
VLAFSIGHAAAVTAVAAIMSLNASNGISVVTGPGNMTISVVRVVVPSNGLTSIQSHQSNGGVSSATVGSSVLCANNDAVGSTGSGAALSYANNQVTGNASNGSFTGTASSQ